MIDLKVYFVQQYEQNCGNVILQNNINTAFCGKLKKKTCRAL